MEAEDILHNIHRYRITYLHALPSKQAFQIS